MARHGRILVSHAARARVGGLFVLSRSPALLRPRLRPRNCALGKVLTGVLTKALTEVPPEVLAEALIEALNDVPSDAFIIVRNKAFTD